MADPIALKAIEAPGPELGGPDVVDGADTVGVVGAWAHATPDVNSSASPAAMVSVIRGRWERVGKGMSTLNAVYRVSGRSRAPPGAFVTWPA